MKGEDEEKPEWWHEDRELSKDDELVFFFLVVFGTISLVLIFMMIQEIL